MAEIHGIIPAAGIGARLGGEMPKQFMPIAGRPMVDHAIQALLAEERISKVHVILSPESRDIACVPGSSLPDRQKDRTRLHYCGGSSRAETVAAAGSLFASDVDALLVIHDAARPCLHLEDIQAVLDAALNGEKAALLAEPLAATLKQEQGGRSVATIDREGKWLAQTPQILPLDLLRDSLAELPPVTDEAGALEQQGIFPRLVASKHPNPKITTLADLAIAEAIISARQSIE